jgi:hypothetical protein
MNVLHFETVQWAFPVAVTLHNLEEAIWLPGFWAERYWHLPVNATEFRIGAALVAGFAYALTYVSIRHGAKSVATYGWAIFSAIMLLNAVWHVGATVYLRVYAPGLVTAVVVILPVTIYLLRRGLREGYI